VQRPSPPLGTNEHAENPGAGEPSPRTGEGSLATTRGDLAISLPGERAKRLNDFSDLFLADARCEPNTESGEHGEPDHRDHNPLGHRSSERECREVLGFPAGTIQA
jgi:hypothetical protein